MCLSAFPGGGELVESNHHVAVDGHEALLYSIVRNGKWAHVTYGSLVDVPTQLPSHHIFVGSMAQWEKIRDELPQYEGHVG